MNAQGWIPKEDNTFVHESGVVISAIPENDRYLVLLNQWATRDGTVQMLKHVLAFLGEPIDQRPSTAGRVTSIDMADGRRATYESPTEAIKNLAQAVRDFKEAGLPETTYAPLLAVINQLTNDARYV